MKNIPKQKPTPANHPMKVDKFQNIIKSTPSGGDQKTMKKVYGICLLMKKNKGRPVLVGGFVRDLILKKLGERKEVSFKDIDIEIYDLHKEEVESALSKDPNELVSTVGKSYGVYKIGNEIDVSLPREEEKVGSGHKGFKTSFSNKLSIHQASSRRDFTCNAIAIDPFTGEIIDSHNGVSDILEKKLKCVDAKKFAEDPLRVLRAMRFAAVLGFNIEESTKKVCQKIDLSELSNSRIGEEWKKMLLKSTKPSIGLKVAKELKILEKLHPEINNLIGLEQSKKYHPEGDVFEHTAQSLDHAKKICTREKLSQGKQLILLLSVLCHDFGKVTTTRINGEKITSYGHPKVSAGLAKSFLKKIELPQKNIPEILKLIEHHDALIGAHIITEKFVNKLADKIKPATIKDLVFVMEADYMGRGELSHENSENIKKLTQLVKIAKKLNVFSGRLEKLIQGRDLLDLGFLQSPNFKLIIDSAYKAQQEGKIKTKEEAIAFVIKNYSHLKK